MAPSEFESHQIFDKLEQISSRISEKELRELVDLDNVNFLETALNYINDKLKVTIPALVQESELNNISIELERSLAQINSFIGNKNFGHITNAINHLYTAITRVRNLPLPFTKNDFNFSKDIARFEKITKEKYKSLEAENTTIKDKLGALNIKLESANSELENTINLLKKKELEIHNINKSFQANFEGIKSSATLSYENDRQAFRSEFEVTKKAHADEIEKLKKSIDTGTDQIIKKLNIKLNEANKIVGVVGDRAVTGNYQKVANEHKTAANLYRGCAFILMIVFSFLLIYTIWGISGENFDWTRSLVRILAVGALSYPATYAARESSKHRKLEILNRTAELELSAINPFIELLPEQNKQLIKEKLVEKYFGNNTNLFNDLEDKKEEVSVNLLERIIKALLPIINK